MRQQWFSFRLSILFLAVASSSGSGINAASGVVAVVVA